MQLDGPILEKHGNEAAQKFEEEQLEMRRNKEEEEKKGLSRNVFGTHGGQQPEPASAGMPRSVHMHKASSQNPAELAK